MARVVMACALKHHTRRGERDPERWQMASQLVTHALIRDAGFTLPPDAEAWDDLSVEQAYDRLPTPEDGDSGDDGDAPSGAAGASGAEASQPSPDGDDDNTGEPSGSSDDGDPQDGDDDGGEAERAPVGLADEKRLGRAEHLLRRLRGGGEPAPEFPPPFQEPGSPIVYALGTEILVSALVISFL